MTRVSACLAIVLSVSSCAHRPHEATTRKARAAELAACIHEDYPSVPSPTVRRFAAEAVEGAADLRESYGVNLTAWGHNFMVNTGMRPRGLCYHWAFDLYRHLDEHVPPGLQMSLVSAYVGNSFREHHAIGLHALGEEWEEGILLDGWKHGGNLIFKRFSETKTPWRYLAENPTGLEW